MVRVIKAAVPRLTLEDSNPVVAYVLDLRPTKEFRSESGLDKLINLQLAQRDIPGTKFHIPDDYATGFGMLAETPGRQESFLRLAGFVDTGSALMASFWICSAFS